MAFERWASAAASTKHANPPSHARRLCDLAASNRPTPDCRLHVPLLYRLHALARRSDQDRHVAVGMAVLVHELVALARLVEGKDAREAGIDLSLHDEVVERVRLLVVGEMRALQPLLPH